MTQWITLQDAAEMIGVRKGTLAMWRLRGRFPFRTKGKGRGLRVSKNAVASWMEAGGRAGIRPGRPAGRRKPGRPPKSAGPGPGRRGRSRAVTLHTDSGLADIQRFVAAVKSGSSIRVAPDTKGFVLSVGK